MSIPEAFWLLALILVAGLLAFQVTIWLAGWAERLVWWVKDHAAHR